MSLKQPMFGTKNISAQFAYIFIYGSYFSFAMLAFFASVQRLPPILVRSDTNIALMSLLTLMFGAKQLLALLAFNRQKLRAFAVKAMCLLDVG